MKQLSSSSNPLFLRWKSLLTGKGLREEGLFLLSGEKLVREFLRETPQGFSGNPSSVASLEIDTELVPPGGRPWSRAQAVELAAPLFKALDPVGTGANILVVRAPEIPLMDPTRPAHGLEVVVPVGDPLNLGAIARSAVAFGASRLILTEESAHPLLPKAIKASAGALLKIPLARTGAPLRDFSAAGRSVALDLDGVPLPEFKWPKDVRLIVGEEGPGLGELRGVERLSIPTGSVESLNAAVAAGIACFAFRVPSRLG